MQAFANLDEAVDRLANGCDTLSSDNLSSYNIRAIFEESVRLGRPLSVEESKNLYQ